jgi:hypothetical protein
MEITYLLKLGLTPKRKVAYFFGRLCEEGKAPINQILHKVIHK